MGFDIEFTRLYSTYVRIGVSETIFTIFYKTLASKRASHHKPVS